MTIEVGGGGSGGVFVPSFASTAILIGNGASGIIFTITPPSGERVRLNNLVGAQDTVNTELKIGNVVIISGKTLKATPFATDSYCVSNSGGNATTTNTVGNLFGVFGGVNEAISFRLITGSTPNTVTFSYEFGALR
jgi:hypothetical protein